MQTTDKEEKEWLSLLRKGDKIALQQIFYRYYKYLVITAHNILHDDGRAKDMVQDVFFDLWRKRQELTIQGSLKAYLRKAVVNRAIDVWRSDKRKGNKEDLDTINPPATEATVLQNLEEGEMQNVINSAIDSLPERCRQVFALSRFENMSHQEISEKLNISGKTIENQMTKALRIIRAAIDKSGMIILLIWMLSLFGI